MFSDADYEQISNRVRKLGRYHHIQEADIQDIIQEVALDVLTNQVLPEKYNTVIGRHLGKFRQWRYRDGERARKYRE